MQIQLKPRDDYLDDLRSEEINIKQIKHYISN